MNVRERNHMLSLGELDHPGLFPHLEGLRRQPRTFRIDFGLPDLPREPGILIIRGPRQSGKSTWIESALRDSVTRHGPGSAYSLIGDELMDSENLVQAIRDLATAFDPNRKPHRLFIDEVTAVRDWERALKRLADEGVLRDILVVTTGSKATDLRRGSERLPGRKGRLDRTVWLFTPVSYAEFARVAGPDLGESCLYAYLLAGGSPVACAEVASTGLLPEYVAEMTRDWVLGEFAAAGRSRSSLLAVLNCLDRFGGTPVGQAKVAREAGLANNTVAAGYLELLADLMIVGWSPAWDASRRVPLARRPAKVPFVNLLAASCWNPARPRTVREVRDAPPERQGRWLEWLVAQELWRRAAIRGDPTPEILPHWRGGDHEIDFVAGQDLFIEVTRGRASPIEYAWFQKTFPDGRLIVVGQDRFRTERIRGVTFEDFLSNPDWS